MQEKLPFVFVGSSTEGLDIAKAVQANLDFCCECQIWSQGVFGLSEGPMESLIRNAGNYDFAILVVTPDDIVISRGAESPSARDNVLFELGLFIGRIGRDRTFMVIERDAGIKIPSDLTGITPAAFQKPESGTLQSALGAACTQIEQRVKAIGRRSDTGVAAEIVGSQSIENLGPNRGFRVGLALNITNIGDVSIPPYTVQLFHPKLGWLVFFHSEKKGEQLPGQFRQHEFPILRLADLEQPGELLSPFPDLKDDREGRRLDESDDQAWVFVLVLEDSNRILYRNSRLGRALVTVLRNVFENKTLTVISWEEMMALRTDV
jgi:hypothetical protein